MKMAETRSTSRRLGCLILLGYGLLWAVVIAVAFGLVSCASAPEPRWTALSVAGTGHDQVWLDGRPRTPGLYRIVATEPGKADFYRGSTFVGRGTFGVIEPDSGNVKLEVAPGARVVITPGN